MPEEIKKITGKLNGFGERKRGKKEDGTEWILFEYKILTPDGKEKTLTGFDKCTELLGEEVEVEYKEVTDGDRHYNNLISIEKSGALDEANKKYNMKPVGAPTAPKAEGSYNDGAFVGMIFNKTIDWIMNERIINKEYTLDEHFNLIFDHFYKKALEKRKEKLG